MRLNTVFYAQSSKEKGSILIVAIWMLALLFLFTMSLGRRANQELLLVKYSYHKMQARYMAWAGFNYAKELIREDSQNENSKLYDNHFACGVTMLPERTPKDIFKNITLSKGSFNISVQKNDLMLNEDEIQYGLGDEDGKLNLNALNLQDFGFLKELLKVIGVPEEEAMQIASGVLDWKDEDSEPALGRINEQSVEGPFGVTRENWPAKNRPIENIAELKFIKGMTAERYEKIKGLVTTFPRQAQRQQINFATAPAEVLLALANFFSGSITNTSMDDAKSLVNKFLATRLGADKIEATKDDLLPDETKMSLTMPEGNILRSMSQWQTKISHFLSIRVDGKDDTGQVKSHIDAILDRENLMIVSWGMN